ncbi:hypothetical protein LWI29_035468 [Acer saccharum]|uniref:Uncharacterized protein n=1 Tax=Acer saccharum TaxID=4024 RepID=A0AA39W1F2_ACESA|nr:hypothetical protein LWI29_035468 [Acer saccharum]
MGESEADQSFFKRHWEGFKDFWTERFSFLENYSRFVNRDEPLPSWSSSDVEQFIASDPIHGPLVTGLLLRMTKSFPFQLKTARQAVNFAITGSVIGAASTAGVAWKYSKSPHGTVLALGAGAVFGVTFGQEVASHWYQLYRLDTMAAQPLSSLLTSHRLFSHLSSAIAYIISSPSTRHVFRRRPPPLAHHVPFIGEASHGFNFSEFSHADHFSDLSLSRRVNSPLLSLLSPSPFSTISPSSTNHAVASQLCLPLTFSTLSPSFTTFMSLLM